MVKLNRRLAVMALVLTGQSALGDHTAQADPLFQANDVLAMRLEAPLRALARDRDAAPEYRPARLTFTDLDGTQRTLDIKVRPRGKSRRDPGFCRMPPLRLNLRKGDVGGTLFDGQDKLKLVTYCKNSDRYEQYVLREYLAYRLLNLLTDASFRVRLLRMTYVDSDRGGKGVERYSFLIEHKRRLARRLDSRLIERESVDRHRLHGPHASIVELFQYMIANTDFSLVQSAVNDEVCCHNAVLFAGDGDQVLSVPYDFDVTGFVDPPYAVPPEGLRLRNVRQRLFRGFCRADGSLERAVTLVRERRAALLATVEEQPGLDRRSRARALDFLGDFFAILGEPDRLDRKILDACRYPL